MDEGQAEVPMARDASPFHWVNGQGLSLRLQVMLTIRDEQDRVALVRLKEHPEHWWIPAETLRPNEPVKEGAQRVSKTWFGKDLDPVIEEVHTWPWDGSGEPKWYILHRFEAYANEDELERLPDTAEVRFVEPGSEAPGPFAMGHADVWPLIE